MKQKIHGAEWLYISLLVLFSLNNHCPGEKKQTGNYVKVSNSGWNLEAKVRVRMI